MYGLVFLTASKYAQRAVTHPSNTSLLLAYQKQVRKGGIAKRSAEDELGFCLSVPPFVRSLC